MKMIIIIMYCLVLPENNKNYKRFWYWYACKT